MSSLSDAHAGVTAEPVSRDQTLRYERGQGKNNFSCSVTTSKIGNLTRLILTLAICVGYTYIHIYIYYQYTETSATKTLKRFKYSPK